MLAGAHVTNEMFLCAAFGEAWPAAHVTGFAHDPATAPGYVWAGVRAGRGISGLRADDNTYVVVSTFAPGAHGRGRRRKELFRAAHMIVLDDMSEKLRPGATLTALGAPSYRLETSPGSEQWGYFLDRPETDMARVDALVTGLIASGLNPGGTDPGMKGVTRYVRLPVGRNTKAKCGWDGFACVLREWAPERRFTLDALASALDIDLSNLAPRKAIPSRRPGERDLVRDALELLGLVKGPAANDDWLDITCPFVDEHTGRADTGTGYSLTGGGFKCNHGHCADRQTPVFKAEIVTRLEAEGHGGSAWFARQEFQAADNDALRALRTLVRDNQPIAPGLASRLACVPPREITRELAAAGLFYGTDPKPVRAAIRRARRAWRNARKLPRMASATVPLPPGYQAPVSLAEQQAEMARVLDRIVPGPRPDKPRALVRARRRYGHAGAFA